MKLLGLFIHPQSAHIIKGLHPGWFPFGKYDAPVGNGIISIPDYPEEIENIYSNSESPHIELTAIVGMNGAGKSTLLEVLYKLINNYAISTMTNKYANSHSRHLEKARGLYADLYVYISNSQYKISCKDSEIEINQSKNNEFVKIFVTGTKRRKVFENLFYTIVTNYSLYAFNSVEIETSNPKKLSSKWLDGLFHKNDGYFTPIVLTPYRSDGNIDVNNENMLAEQRINAMALLASVKNESFIPGYTPVRIIKSFDKNYEKIKRPLLEVELKNHAAEWLSSDRILNVFTLCWKQRLSSIENLLIDTHDDALRTALFYLAFKSIKLSLRYADYRECMKYNKREIAIKNGELREADYYDTIATEDCNRLITKIFNEIDISNEHNHLTLKIEQTIQFIKNRIEELSSESNQNKRENISLTKVSPIETFLRGKAIKTYSDVFNILPPPFFHVKLEFAHTNSGTKSNWESFNMNDSEVITLESMSSGERHLLNCLSYVLYHIKNIESIKSDGHRIKYRNILLIFDEIELYFHPEYQRRFISMMLEAFKWCNISIKNISSIQVLIVTHSPFVLTDVFTHNTLYLNKGRAMKVDNETFGANYYDILGDSFFFTDSAIGKISTEFISRLAKRIMDPNVKNNSLEIASQLTNYIGDQMIVNYLKNHFLKK